MNFEIFLTIFDSNIFNNDIQSLLYIKSTSTDSLHAFRVSNKKRTISTLLLSQKFMSFGEISDFKDIFQDNYLTYHELVKMLSSHLFDYKITNNISLLNRLQHSLLDRQFPVKFLNINGNRVKTLSEIRRVINQITSNRNVDCIVNFPFKPNYTYRSQYSMEKLNLF